MKVQPAPIAKDLVLVGGGHAHVIVLRMLGMNPMPGLQVTLVSPDERTPYSGMLPGVVAGHYSEDDIHIELGPLCRFAGARFIRARATGLDPDARQLLLEDHPPLDYDALSLDIGITPAVDAVPGAAEHAIAVKPINRFLAKFDEFLVRVRDGEVRRAGIVGTGAGGVELCLAIWQRLQTEHFADVQLHLFGDGEAILSTFPEPVQDAFAETLRTRLIEFHPGFRVSAVTERGVVSNEGKSVDLDAVFFVTQAASQRWLAGSGLALDENGFVQVRDTLQSSRHPDVFAVGDIAANVDHPRPKAGVFAVRQGKPLFRNLKRQLLGLPPMPFRPQRDFLSLISTGDKAAVASKWGRSMQGRWVWRWKDWIDRRFMARFSDLPAMPAPPRTGLLAGFDEQMQCGGCGSKVAADLLAEVLGELGMTEELDDAALIDVPPGKTLLQSVDGFRTFVDDPYLLARIAANHALSDIHAMGGTPVSAQALITVPFASPSRTRSMLRLVMAGAREVFEAEQVRLVGGHTSEGMEMQVAFAVNGLVDAGRAVRKGGLRDGDVLILTKPLGTGVLFAADMQGKARGRWIRTVIDSMLASNGPAARALVEHGVHAMTDVTGFGLAGHLFEMLDASSLAAELDMASLPVFDGALEMLDAGITSTLQAGNERARGNVAPSADIRRAMLFDPQTAGGLLAAVAADQADDVVAALQAAGATDAVVIGRVMAGEPAIAFRAQAEVQTG